ncbi:HAD family hydrolase [Streptomyces lydicus]|uniref:HAD family hydrolase n=1 Tax=Streptomyces lydicus TaxID=47763 RepID=UPI0037B27627
MNTSMLDRGARSAIVLQVPDFAAEQAVVPTRHQQERLMCGPPVERDAENPAADEAARDLLRGGVYPHLAGEAALDASGGNRRRAQRVFSHDAKWAPDTALPCCEDIGGAWKRDVGSSVGGTGRGGVRVIGAVLWDFAGTLMAPETAERWVDGALREAEVTADAMERRAWARRAAAAGLPAPVTPREWSERERAVWRDRDRDPGLHRALGYRLLTEAELPWPRAASALYERHMSPAGWQPYPDAGEVLRRVRSAGLRSCVVSNIGWDLRPVLQRAGLLDLLDDVVMSYQHGVRKPDPAIFRIACERIDVAPTRTVMVGDSPRADVGGERLGIRTLLIAPLPPTDRPDGLGVALELAGVL